MTDKRIPVFPGTVIKLGNTEYTILRLSGRGGSCMVYDAEYFDGYNCVHKVRIKEFYPVSESVIRNERNTVCFESGATDLQDNFLKSVTLHSSFRQIKGSINSTAPIRSIEYANGTIYCIMDYIDGVTLNNYFPESFLEIIDILKKTVQVLKEYHKEGWLHLDIKPENILCLRSVSGDISIRLFDFDSMVRIKELSNESTVISCSEGYAAPEVKNRDVSRISIESDFFSVGCILFQYFNKHLPGTFDMRVRPVRLKRSLLQSDASEELYRLLNEFFNHTVTASPSDRYHFDDEVLSALEHIYAAAETAAPELISTLPPALSYFIGRTNEMRIIKQEILSRPVLLTGTGGSGKSSLALQYAIQEKSNYDLIIFAFWNGSWEITVSDEQSFCIRNLPESCKTPSQRLELIKKLCTSDTLIILDNFDSDNTDELLDIWLEFPCHVLITSRMRPNIERLSIIDTEILEEAEELIYHYSNCKFDEKELLSLKKMVYSIDNHAMTASLIGKLIKSTGILPSEIYNAFSKNGLETVNDKKIRNTKDRKLSSGAVSRHIDILFDMFGFTEEERRILQILSIIPLHSIRYDLLKKWVDETIETTIKLLIGKGWIQERSTDSVSLHPVIADRIMHNLPSDAVSCGKLLSKIRTELINTYIKNRKAYKYILTFCRGMLKNIKGAGAELFEFEETLGLSCMSGKLSEALIFLGKAASTGQQLGLDEPVGYRLCLAFSDYDKNLFVSEQHGNSGFTKLKEAVIEESAHNLSFFSSAMIGELCAARAISFSTQFIYDIDEADENFLWEYAEYYKKQAYRLASTTQEQKKAATMLYDFYSDISNPLSSEVKALEYKLESERQVIFYQNGEEVQRSDQEEISDKISALNEDGDYKSALSEVLRLTEEYKRTREPLDPFLFIQAVNILRANNYDDLAIMLLEEQKNNYNAYELAEINLNQGNKAKALEWLEVSERYWQNRLKDSEEEHIPLARIELLKARSGYKPNISISNALKIFDVIHNNELRHDDHETALDCLNTAKQIQSEYTGRLIEYFPFFASVYDITEEQEEEFNIISNHILFSDDMIVTYDVFLGELAGYNDDYEKQQQMFSKALSDSMRIYGENDVRNAQIMYSLAEITSNDELYSKVQYDVIAAKEIQGRLPEQQIYTLLGYADKYRKYDIIEKISSMENQAYEILDSIHDDYSLEKSYHCFVQYYIRNSMYEKAILLLTRLFEIAEKKRRGSDMISYSLNLSEIHKKNNDFDAEGKWLEKAEEIARNNAKPEKYAQILETLEEFSLMSGNYIKAAKWRTLYNETIQQIIT